MISLIIGNYPLSRDIESQCRSRYQVKRCDWDDAVDLRDCAELFLTPDLPDAAAASDVDNRSLSWLAKAAKGEERGNSDEKIRVHLMVHSLLTFNYLQQHDFAPDIRERFDVYPFNLDDEWSKTIQLDRDPVTVQSEASVHLVIFGSGDIAELVAVNAAHRAHFPNYVRNHELKTRITVVDEQIDRWGEDFRLRYKHLFDYSYYRLVDTSKTQMVVDFHQPDNLEGGEFVDIEWEFVKSSENHPALRAKMSQWTLSDKQQLTVVCASRSARRNLTVALRLPEELARQQVPVHVYMHDDVLLSATQSDGSSFNLIPFGLVDRGYDISLPSVQMGMMVNYINNLCYNDNIENWSGQPLYAVEVDDAECMRQWDRLSAVKRKSSICNAATIPVKMRSMGIVPDDWDKFYEVPQQTIDLMAEVEHNRWNVEELLLGWRPCTPEEQKLVEEDVQQKEVLKQMKIHYDLRPYSDLRPDCTGRPVTIYDICLSAAIPLIAGSVK